MQQRAGVLLEGKGRAGAKRTKQSPPRPEISTFHSLCVRILRRNIKRLGYPERFVICDRSDQESQARAVLRELRAPATALAPGDLLGYIGRWKTPRSGRTTRRRSPKRSASTWPRPAIAATRTRSRRTAPSTSTICCC